MLSNRIKLILILFLSAALLLVIFRPGKTISTIKYELTPKTEFYIKLSKINRDAEKLSADPSNKLAMLVAVKNSKGEPVPSAHVLLSVSDGFGSFEHGNVRTDENGEYIANFVPKNINGNKIPKEGTAVVLTASLAGGTQKSTDTIKLIRVPAVMVHGYQESEAVFDTMKDYLNSRGFSADSFSYESVKGVISSVKELETFLSNKTQEYMKKGTQVSKYDVISHSMGGLVARYYSCSSDYMTNDNVRKLIFVSVPHKGTPWASIGTNYFNDQGIKDLIPDGPFISKTLPSTLNKGLNNKIEVGNIAVEFDEVVPSENSSLSEWGINTEVFNIGGNNFTFDNIISGNIIQAPNHKNILSNRKSFEAVERMLNNDLPFPSVKN